MHPLVDQLGLLDLKPVRRGAEGEGEKEREGRKRAKKGEICCSCYIVKRRRKIAREPR